MGKMYNYNVDLTKSNISWINKAQRPPSHHTTESGAHFMIGFFIFMLVAFIACCCTL